MAVSANTVWDVDTAGSTNNGGGFVTGATGSFQTTAINITGVTSAGAGNTCLHASAADSWVGNIINVVSGTNFTTTAGAARFEITSVVVGVSFTCSTNISGASISTGVGSNGNMYIGGRVKFYNSSVDDALLENSVAGNKWYIKTGTHSVGTLNLTVSGTQLLPVYLIGYNATYGDNPSIASGNQPTLDFAANGPVWGTLWKMQYTTQTGTSANGVQPGTSARVEYCKFTNTSGTAGRTAMTPGADSAFIGCEFSSTAGPAVQSGAAAVILYYGCYFHDSDKGLRQNHASAGCRVINCIFDTLTTTGIEVATASTVQNIILGNTFYGASTPTGSSKGIDLVTTSQEYVIMNNIFSGWVTAINSADAILSCNSDYNNFYNNTTNRTNWPTGANDIALDPAFTNAASADFSTGPNMYRVGFPSAFPGNICTAYNDIGAVRSNYTSLFTDVNTANVLTAQGDFKYNSATNNRTPTAVASAGQKFIHSGDY